MAEKFMDKANRTWVAIPAPNYIDGQSGQDLLDVALQLLQVGFSRLALDMASTRAVNSVGISRLIGIIETLEKKDGKLALCTPNPAIAKTFQIMGLAKKALVCRVLQEVKDFTG